MTEGTVGKNEVALKTEDLGVKEQAKTKWQELRDNWLAASDELQEKTRQNKDLGLLGLRLPGILISEEDGSQALIFPQAREFPIGEQEGFLYCLDENGLHGISLGRAGVSKLWQRVARGAYGGRQEDESLEKAMEAVQVRKGQRINCQDNIFLVGGFAFNLREAMLVFQQQVQKVSLPPREVSESIATLADIVDASRGRGSIPEEERTSLALTEKIAQMMENFAGSVKKV